MFLFYVNPQLLIISRKIIREAAKDAVINYKDIPLFKIEGPYRIKVCFYSKEFALKVYGMKKIGKKEINNRTITVEGDNLYKLWTCLKDSIYSNRNKSQ